MVLVLALVASAVAYGSNSVQLFSHGPEPLPGDDGGGNFTLAHGPEPLPGDDGGGNIAHGPEPLPGDDGGGNIIAA